VEEVCRKVGKKGEYHKNMEPAIVELSVVVGGGFFWRRRCWKDLE